MEGKKKVIILVLLFFIISCSKKQNYYDEQQNFIKSNNVKKIKFNIYTDNKNRIYIRTENIILQAGKDEQIVYKKRGFILQDSIFDNVEQKLVPLRNILDLESYLESVRGIIYQDKNHVYMNKGSQYSDYPFFITEFVSKDFLIISNSSYFKYKNKIYYYGNTGYFEIKDIIASKFTTDSIKTNIGKYLQVGYDEKNIFHDSEKIEYENLITLPISQKIKDSLSEKYFSN